MLASKILKLKNFYLTVPKSYIFIFLIGILFICLTSHDLIKITIAIIPLFLIFIVYLIGQPSSSLILFFFLIPLLSPAFIPQSSLTPAELLAIPITLLCTLSLLTGDKKTIQKTLHKNKHIFFSIFIFFWIHYNSCTTHE